MLERVLKVMSLDSLSMSDFAKKIGVQSSQVSHVKNGRNQVTLDFVTKILVAYPNIDPDWLIFGKGSMFRNSTQQTNTQVDTPQKQPIQLEMRSLFDDDPVIRSEENAEIEITPSEETTPETTLNDNVPSPVVNNNKAEADKETEPEKIKTDSTVTIETATKKEEPHLQYETPRQSVKKIVVLYSDKTYEEFVPNPS